MGSKRAAVLAVVVGDHEEPVYLRDLRTLTSNEENAGNIEEYLHHFILHSSLDMVAEKQWQVQTNYLGVVETFREYSVSAWVGAAGTKLLLLHRGLTEPTVKNLLKGVYSLWQRIAVNPLHEREESIFIPAFEARLAVISGRLLGNA